MLKQIKNDNIFAFADDTAIVVSSNNIKTAYNIMQQQLDIVSMWCHDNGLVINANKTKLMHIRPIHLGTSDNLKIIYQNFCPHVPSVS